MQYRTKDVLIGLLSAALLMGGSPSCSSDPDPGDGEPDAAPGDLADAAPGNLADAMPGDMADAGPHLPPREIGTMTEVVGVQAPIAGRGTRLGGNSTGVHACEYEDYAHYEEPTLGTQLHIVGVHAVDAEQNGEVRVHISRPGSSVLVLAAYNSAHWVVTTAPGVFLERVLLSGYHEQTAEVPADVPVERYNFELDGRFLGIGSSWPHPSTTYLVEESEALTGLMLTSFRGCYLGTEFRIEEPTVIEPPPPMPDERERALIPGCEHLTSESSYCLAVEWASRAAVMVGVDSGSVCRGPSVGENVSFTSSIGWLGNNIYMCSHDQGLMRISMADGSVDIAPFPCIAVTATDDDLIVLASIGQENPSVAPLPYYLARFDSFAYAAKRHPLQFFDPPMVTNAMAMHGDQVYLLRGSELMTGALVSGAPLIEMQLEDFDESVSGFDVTDDGKLVVASGLGFEAGKLFLFDAGTGKQLGSVETELLGVIGMTCVSGQ